MKPILKYVGGKTKLLPELRARMPSTFGRYYEPFLGGGALFLDTYSGRAPHGYRGAATIGDLNSHVMDVYRAVATDVERVIEELTEFRQQYLKHGEKYYYLIRAQWNAGLGDPVSRAAAYILLNKTGYNGLWRENKKGEMNTPAGKYRNPTIFDPDHLRAASVLFRNAILLTGDYRSTTADVDRGDFIYFDPPYDPLTKTASFTAYTADGFGDADQEELAQYTVELEGRGVHVMLSNNDTPFIRNLYRGFKIETVQCARPVNSKGDKRGKVDEVIITSK